jgi:hypothetical protein
MTGQIRATHLPDGSVVAGAHTTYVKDHPSKTAAWRGTRGEHHGDQEVDKAMADGAEVLRVGARSVPSVAGARWGDLTVPERAALDAWTRGSTDTNGMLYAVRHALAVERNAVGRIAVEQNGVGPTLVPDARERLARHLYLLSAQTDQGRRTPAETWDGAEFDRTPWLAQADEILPVITGKEG